MAKVLYIIKRLLLGVILLSAAGGVLLFSDLRSRKGAKSAPAVSPGTVQVHRVALIQHASQTVLEEGVRGILAGLKEKGFEEGRNLALKRYNAEGDLPTANAIAQRFRMTGWISG